MMRFCNVLRRDAGTQNPALSSDSIQICVRFCICFLLCACESTWFGKCPLPDAYLLLFKEEAVRNVPVAELT